MYRNESQNFSKASRGTMGSLAWTISGSQRVSELPATLTCNFKRNQDVLETGTANYSRIALYPREVLVTSLQIRRKCREYPARRLKLPRKQADSSTERSWDRKKIWNPARTTRTSLASRTNRLSSYYRVAVTYAKGVSTFDGN